MKKILLHSLELSALLIMRPNYDEKKKAAWVATIRSIIIEIQTVEDEEEAE